MKTFQSSKPVVIFYVTFNSQKYGILHNLKNILLQNTCKCRGNNWCLTDFISVICRRQECRHVHVGVLGMESCAEGAGAAGSPEGRRMILRVSRMWSFVQDNELNSIPVHELGIFKREWVCWTQQHMPGLGSGGRRMRNMAGYIVSLRPGWVSKTLSQPNKTQKYQWP